MTRKHFDPRTLTTGLPGKTILTFLILIILGGGYAYTARADEAIQPVAPITAEAIVEAEDDATDLSRAAKIIEWTKVKSEQFLEEYHRLLAKATASVGDDELVEEVDEVTEGN